MDIVVEVGRGGAMVTVMWCVGGRLHGQRRDCIGLV